jgi:hypothetical protein
MGPLGHAAVSLALGGSLYAATGDLAAGAAAFVSGTLIDADHLYHYVRSEGFRFRPKSLRSGAYFAKSGRAFVFLHSYEVVIPASMLCGIVWGPQLALGLAAGALAHLACDVAFYRFSPLCYSLWHRIRHGFALSAFRPDAESTKGS